MNYLQQKESVLKKNNTTLEKIMVSEETETKPMVLEGKTNEETNTEGTRIVRTKQPKLYMN